MTKSGRLSTLRAEAHPIQLSAGPESRLSNVPPAVALAKDRRDRVQEELDDLKEARRRADVESDSVWVS